MDNKNIIYLNNNASSAMPEVVKSEIQKWFNSGNASVDAKSQQLITDTKNYIAKLNNISLDDYEVIFTSCGSESNSTIINAVANNIKNKKYNIIISSIEHNSILKSVCNFPNITCKQVIPDNFGIIHASDIEKLIDKNTLLISIMYMNNEIGSINNIGEIGALANKNNILFHCDAVQMYGKCKINIPKKCIDVLSASFHKLYGPPGIGLLILNKKVIRKHNINFIPLISGSQNNNLRGGTENIPYIAGCLAAMKWNFSNRIAKNNKIVSLMDMLFMYLNKRYTMINYNNFDMSKLKKDSVVLVYYGYKNVASQSHNTLLLSIVTKKIKICNIKIKKYLEKNKIYVGIGSACNSKNSKASHVLYSLNTPSIIRRGILRVSLGDYNNKNDIREFCKYYSKIVDQVIKK